MPVPRYRGVAADPAQVAARLPGDDIVTLPDVVMDRGFTVDVAPAVVWPRLVQLGKARAGWYLPRAVERFVPASHRALRHVDGRWQRLAVGDVIPDYGGRRASFEVALIEAPTTLVYRSQRGGTHVSWAITLTAAGPATRVHLRLRLAPVKHRRLAVRVGGFVDLATIAGLAAGLRERLATGV